MLEGKVVFYNEDDGEGAVVAKDNSKYKFDVIDWDDFDHTPEVGLEVKFKTVGDRAKKIKKHIKSTLAKAPSQTLAEAKAKAEARKVKITTNNPNARESKDSKEAQQVATSENERVARASIEMMKKKESEKNISRNIFGKINKDLLDLKEIPLSIPVPKCIADYLSDIQDIVNEKWEDPDSEDEESLRTLDYQRMKRFLTTAYHHLIDRDPDFTDEKFNGLKIELHNLGNSQATLQSQTKHPQTKFDKVFLSRQPEFIKIQKDFVGNQKNIDSLSISLRSLEHTMNEKEKLLKKYKPGSSEYEYMELTLKQVKRQYADLLDTLANLKEINKHLREIKDIFVKKYFPEFMEVFEAKAKELTEKMTFIVDRAAYEFDTYMWQKARKSSSIKQFFIEAQIDGTFSSKTFLKYFINTLDMGKLSTGNQDLVKLLRYLESVETKAIMIINEKSSVLATLNYLTNGLNKDYKVISIQTPIDFYNRVKKDDPDIVIVDAQIRQFELEEYIHDVKEKCPKDVTVVLSSENFSKASIAKAKKMGIDKLLYLNSTEAELQRKLKEIIEEDMRS
jgi:hypothetical protein